MYNCLVLQLKKVFAFFTTASCVTALTQPTFFFFLNHFFGRHWDSASSPCLGGVTGESRLWLQPQGTPIWSTRWSCGEPMLLFPSRTSSFTMVCHVLLPWTSGKLFKLQIGFHLNMCALCVCVWTVMLWEHSEVRDVSKWSARMRQPMEEVYGVQVFAKLWEAWVDGIAQFVHRPEGDGSVLLQAH